MLQLPQHATRLFPSSPVWPLTGGRFFAMMTCLYTGPHIPPECRIYLHREWKHKLAE
jgi:hypothetical protein